jgi:hypothetical protein
MTVLDQFIAFANALPKEQLASVEESLAAMMDSLAPEHDFTQSELAELERRVAEPNPEYSDPDAITRIFGKPFRA